ncbi:hypothetical protein C8Q77DRAFT_655349 [Trametes polyzona]|nr:hypothetical protein C8Q77DRAFT_655349 [Trametes polyzona]
MGYIRRELVTAPYPQISMAPIAFPPEIYDRFIDGQSGDAVALRQCALTSRAWLPRSRCHLYSTVLLRTYAQLFKLSRTLTSNAELPCLVRELILSLPWAGQATIVHSAFTMLSKKLSRLEKLCVVQARSPESSQYINRARLSIPLRTITSIVELADTLTEIRLLDVALASFADLARLIAALPNVTVLLCKVLEWGDAEGVPQDSPIHEAASLRLDRLAVC